MTFSLSDELNKQIIDDLSKWNEISGLALKSQEAIAQYEYIIENKDGDKKFEVVLLETKKEDIEINPESDEYIIKVTIAFRRMKEK